MYIYICIYMYIYIYIYKLMEKICGTLKEIHWYIYIYINILTNGENMWDAKRNTLVYI